MRERKAKEYLSAIYLLGAYGRVRGAYVARELKLSRPTVSVALRALEESGYLTIDEERFVHLTEAGERLAREAMHETVRRGRDYHELVGEKTDDGEPVRRDVTPEQAILRLKQEHATAVLEAVLILSDRYYCVRVIDAAQFLNRPSAGVRAKLRRMEHSGYVVLAEEGVVRLTESGKTLAEILYARHAPERERLCEEGPSPEEAEQRAVLQEFTGKTP